MNPAEMIVLIVLIAVIGGIVLSRQHYAAQAHKGPGDGQDEALRHEMIALRERIKVLERVVTDQHASHDLGSEIERLRDR